MGGIRWFGYSVGQAERVLPSTRDAIPSHGGGRRLSHVYRLWLLAADRGGWCCLATVSVVRDCVKGRRLRYRHHGATWLAADCGGWCCLATVSAARDCVKGQCLRHQHHGATWLVADRGGLLSLAGLSSAVHCWKTAQVTSSACWHGGGGNVCG
jgi:hypothetical protein